LYRLIFAIGAQKNIIGILSTEKAQDLRKPNSASDALELEKGRQGINGYSGSSYLMKTNPTDNQPHFS
jgi:hypothetical protein